MEDKNLHKDMVDHHQSLKIIALYSDIGRGHPSYLDSVLYLLKEKYPDIISRTVFQESRGSSLFLWKLVSWLYRISGRGGLQTKFYNLVRQRTRKDAKASIVTKNIGRDLKRAYENFEGICLVDHPLMARPLADVCRVWYVHGEIAAPAECAIRGVEKILVPLDETKEKLVAQGAEKEAVMVCGLMLEPSLVESAEKAYQERLKRIRSTQPLTIGFFTSGAYPKEHLEKIVLGVRSVIQKKMKAVIFCGINPRKFEWIKDKLKDLNARMVEDKEETSHKSEEFDVMVVIRKTRQSDTQRSVELIPHLDVFVAASHERTNWAIGLGLPMFVLFPLIGSFASPNFEFAKKQKVVHPLDSPEKAKNLGEILHNLRRSGQLVELVKNGFGAHRINGIETVVSNFVENVKLSA